MKHQIEIFLDVSDGKERMVTMQELSNYQFWWNLWSSKASQGFSKNVYFNEKLVRKKLDHKWKRLEEAKSDIVLGGSIIHFMGRKKATTVKNRSQITVMQLMMAKKGCLRIKRYKKRFMFRGGATFKWGCAVAHPDFLKRKDKIFFI